MKIKKLLTQAVLLTLILYGFYYLEHELKRENTLPLLSIFFTSFYLTLVLGTTFQFSDKYFFVRSFK